MSDPSRLTADAKAAVAAAVAELPETLSAGEAIAAVPQLAVLNAHPEAAAAYPNARLGIEMAEYGRLRPGTADEAPTKVSRAYTWVSVIAFVLALAAPALIMTGRNGRAFDPLVGALPSGILMAVALALFIWLEPRRTSNPLYRGGNFGAPMFVFVAAIWAVGVFIVLGAIQDVVAYPEAIVGLVLQFVSTVGSVILAVAAFRHDRERPMWAAGRKPRIGVPADVAATPEFQAAVDQGLLQWRRQVYQASTRDERAALLAAELEAIALLHDRGSLTAEEFDSALERVRSRADWR
ncbi:hypothetical protein ASE14_07560 [Agromyces sp. Root81]|uniref:hypothetical protein n=1 Tax=Agromyces sp. Root81 TaxID=1736601 RepID=UPI0006F26B97|nr:hypothetical protein [Agromyces sp. Root81]KRC60819.1 hypothetical protein ASE14_07560 [Agromyces sp. Root81]